MNLPLDTLHLPHCEEESCPDYELCKKLVEAARPDLCSRRLEEEVGPGVYHQIFIMDRDWRLL